MVAGVQVVAGVAVDELSTLPAERLEAELCQYAAQLAAGTCRHLLLIGEFDRRELAGSWGARSTAHWVAWRCAVDARTAREWVRVARALQLLPAVTESMARGELSYAKVRALTRFATPATEDELLVLAKAATAAQLDRCASAFVKGLQAEAARDEERDEREALHTWVDELGMQVILCRLAPERGAVVVAAIEAQRERDCKAAAAHEGEGESESGPAEPLLEDASPVESGPAEPLLDRSPVEADEPARAEHDNADAGGGGDDAYADWEADLAAEPRRPGDPVFRNGVFCFDDVDDDDEECDSAGGEDEDADDASSVILRASHRQRSIARERADALVNLMLHGGDGRSDGLIDDRYLVMVHVDASVLDGSDPTGIAQLDNGVGLSADTVRRLMCDSPLALLVKDQDGNPLYMGRKIRIANRAQRRAVLGRSKGTCMFPGCDHRGRLAVHHVVEWGEGGPTNVDVLVALCGFHHRCVHHDGFRVMKADGGEFRFYRPNGREIVESPEFGPAARTLGDELARLRAAVFGAPAPGHGDRLDLPDAMTGIFSLHESRNSRPWLAGAGTGALSGEAG